MTDTEKFWLVAALGVIAILLAIATEYATGKWRLAAAAAALLAAAGAASFAINGPDPEVLKRFGPEVALVFRLLATAIALWATYMGAGQIRAWLRHGNRPDDG